MGQYYKMLYLILSLVFIASCSTKPSNELEMIGEDVLKAHQGLEFDIRPLPKDK
jgi:hypothetical protein